MFTQSLSTFHNVVNPCKHDFVQEYFNLQQRMKYVVNRRAIFLFLKIFNKKLILLIQNEAPLIEHGFNCIPMQIKCEM